MPPPQGSVNEREPVLPVESKIKVAGGPFKTGVVY
jgi:hypothetical protein